MERTGTADPKQRAELKMKEEEEAQLKKQQEEQELKRQQEQEELER